MHLMAMQALLGLALVLEQHIKALSGAITLLV